MSFQLKKKRNAKAPPVPSKYSGPVKNDYTGVHAKLSALRSSFKPQGGWHVGRSLIDSHMQAHKQRVESAKACVDTTTPKAMVESTIGKRVWVDGTLRSSIATGRTGQPLQTKNSGKVVQFREHLDSDLPATPDGGAERKDSRSISPGSEPKNSSLSTGANNPSETTPLRVQDTYLTRTARLTAAYNERQSRKCESKVTKTHSSPLPWHPVYPEQAHFKHYPGFSLSCLQSIDQDNLFTPKKQSRRTTVKDVDTSNCSPSMQRTKKNSPSEKDSPSADKRSKHCAAKVLDRTFLVKDVATMDGSGEGSSTGGDGVLPSERGEPGSDSSGTPYTEDFEDDSGADEDLDSNSSSQCETDDPPSSLPLVEHTSSQRAHVCPVDAANGGAMTSSVAAWSVTNSDVTRVDMMNRVMIPNGVTTYDARHTVSSSAVTSGDSVSVQRERDYLAFIARVTQDILARRVYTDAGLKLLFEEHTEKNRDLLDVNEMKKRIQILAQSLNIS